MLDTLASFLHRNRRRVLIVALVGVGIAGGFGLGVAKRLSPYGDTDPSTQSVQATNRFQAATGRQIDPGVIALVTTGDIHSARAERRVRQVEAKLHASRDIATVSSYYDSHDAAMVSRDRRSTYVVGYFQPKSDSRIQDDATRLEGEFAGQHDVELGGAAIADAQVNTQVGNDLARAEVFAFPFIFLLSLLFFRSLIASLLPPFLGVLAILTTFFALRIVSSVTDLSVFALNVVTGLAPKRLQRAADRDARPAESGFWYRFSRAVIARPRRIALLSAAALIALGVPFASITFQPANASVLPTSASAYRVDAALRTEFPPGRTSPLEVVVGAPAGSLRLSALAARIRALPNVAAVAPAEPVGRHLSLLDVAPSTPTYSAASQQLVHAVRALRTPFSLGVAGDTAGYVDLEHSLGAHLPLVPSLMEILGTWNWWAPRPLRRLHARTSSAPPAQAQPAVGTTE